MAGSTQQAHQQRYERVAPRQDISQHQLKKNAKTQMHLRQQLWGLTKNISHPKCPQPAAAGTGLEPASSPGAPMLTGTGQPKEQGGQPGEFAPNSLLAREGSGQASGQPRTLLQGRRALGCEENL